VSEVRRLADEHWEYYRGSAQLWNIDRGDVDQIELWEDLSSAGIADRVTAVGGDFFTDDLPAADVITTGTFCTTGTRTRSEP
jgi:hypothetical protein